LENIHELFAYFSEKKLTSHQKIAYAINAADFKFSYELQHTVSRIKNRTTPSKC